MPIPTNDELLKMAEAHARATMIGGKRELLPVAHLIKPDGGELVLGTPWRNDFEKELTQRMLRELIKAGEVIRYAITCEAWSAKAREGDDLDTMIPADPPVRKRDDRKEVVMAVAVDRGGSTIRIWDTKRDANGNCVDLVPDESAIDHKGAFLDLMKDV